MSVTAALSEHHDVGTGGGGGDNTGGFEEPNVAAHTVAEIFLVMTMPHDGMVASDSAVAANGTYAAL